MEAVEQGPLYSSPCSTVTAAAQGCSELPQPLLGSPGLVSVQSRESRTLEGNTILPTLTCCGHRGSQVPGRSCGLSSLLGEQLPKQSRWNQPILHIPGLAQLLCQHEMRQSLSEDSLPKHTANSDEVEVQAPFVPCKCWRVPKRVHDGTNLNEKNRPF